MQNQTQEHRKIGLTPDHQEKLAYLGQEWTFSRNQRVFSEEDDYRGAFQVQTGRFKVFNCGESGRETLLHIFEPGEWIASAPLFMGAPRYHSCCSCISPGSLAFYPAPALTDLILSDAQLCYALAAVSMRYAFVIKEKLVDFTQVSARERLLKYLKGLGAAESAVPLPFPKNQLAAMLNISAEMLSRCLHELKKSGLLIEENGTYLIKE